MDPYASQPLIFFNLYAIPPFLTSITALILGLKVSNASNAKLNQLFLGWCTCVFVWLFSYSVCYATTDESLAVLLSEFACTGVLFFATTFYHFILVFLKRKKEMTVVKIGYLINIAIIPLTFTTPLFLNGVKKVFFGYYVVASTYYWALLVLFFGFALRALFLLIIALKKNQLPPEDKRRAEYFVFALSLAYFSATDFLPKFGIIFYPFGSFIIFIWMLIMTYAVLEKDLVDLKIILHRWLPCIIAVGTIIVVNVGVIVYQQIK
jgi:hypothetical protein